MVYDKIACIYDELMSHVDYNQWFKLIKRVKKRYQPLNKNFRILEIGCGTGRLGKRLRNIYKTDFSDISYQMCLKANKRLKRKNLFCCNASNIPIKKDLYDMVIFLYDGINYLELDEYEELASEVSRVLKYDGLFLFDITTEFNSMNFFRDYTDIVSYRDIICKRHSYYITDKRIQKNIFNIYFDNGEETEEIHCQNVYSPEEIRGRVSSNGLKIEGIWDNFSMDKYREDSERIHFLLRKL